MRTAIFLSLVLGVVLGAQARGEVYEFSASWCGPCQQFAPTIDHCIAAGMPIRKLDFDQQRKFAAQCGVDSIPALVAIKDNRVVDKTVGAVSVERIKQLCDAAGDAPKRQAARETWDDPRIVKVVCDDGDGRSLGSGAFVGVSGHICVLTAWHVINSGGGCQVIASDGSSTQAKVAAYDDRESCRDCAILDIGSVNQRDIKHFDIAKEAPERAHVWLCGFPNGLGLRIHAGDLVSLGYPTPPIVNSPSIEGDSGGAVVNDNGELVGLIVATNETETFVCPLNVIKDCCGRAQWQYGGQQVNPPPQPQYQPQSPITTAPQPPPIATQPPAQTCPCGDIDAKITAEVRLQIAALNLHDGQDGQQGPKGEQGPQGPKGETGLTGAAGVSPSAQEIADKVTIPQIDIDAVSTAVLAKLPPFYERANPNEQWQPVKLGQYLDLSLNKQQAAAK